MAAENIIIGGGGKSPTMEKLFLDKIARGGRLLLCPLASTDLPMTMASRNEWIKTVRPDIAMDAMNDDNAATVELNAYDALFITGGNTYKLLDAIYANNLVEKLNTFRKSGRPIYGGSAGAVIMGPNIDICRPADDPSLGDKNTAGLNWLDQIEGGGGELRSGALARDRGLCARILSNASSSRDMLSRRPRRGV